MAKQQITLYTETYLFHIYTTKSEDSSYTWFISNELNAWT